MSRWVLVFSPSPFSSSSQVFFHSRLARPKPRPGPRPTCVYARCRRSERAGIGSVLILGSPLDLTPPPPLLILFFHGKPLGQVSAFSLATFPMNPASSKHGARLTILTGRRLLGSFSSPAPVDFLRNHATGEEALAPICLVGRDAKVRLLYPLSPDSSVRFDAANADLLSWTGTLVTLPMKNRRLSQDSPLRLLSDPPKSRKNPTLKS